jgi:hypothetical protein
MCQLRRNTLSTCTGGKARTGEPPATSGDEYTNCATPVVSALVRRTAIWGVVDPAANTSSFGVQVTLGRTARSVSAQGQRDRLVHRL